MKNETYLSQLDEDNVHITTRPYLNKVLKHTNPYEVDVLGTSITILPGVMSPEYDWAGLYMIDCLPENLQGKHVLELGPGSGLVSVFAGLRGAASITCDDINPEAVKNTELNLKKYNIKSEVFLSNVFSNIPKNKYDIIIFNLPYHNGVPRNDLEKGVIDAEYNAMIQFFAEANNYLKESGTLYAGFSRSGDVSLLMEHIQKNGFKVDTFEEKNSYEKVERFVGQDFHYNCQVYTLSHNNNATS